MDPNTLNYILYVLGVIVSIILILYHILAIGPTEEEEKSKTK